MVKIVRGMIYEVPLVFASSEDALTPSLGLEHTTGMLRNIVGTMILLDS